MREAFDLATELSKKGNVFVENDLRAHTNPTRMANILKALEDLSTKMNSTCPECESMGSGSQRNKGACYALLWGAHHFTNSQYMVMHKVPL